MKAQSGRIGGLKGGQARAKKLTSEEGTAIARKVARTRWKKQFNNMIACAKLQLNYDRHPHLKISREALDWFAPRSKAGIPVWRDRERSWHVSIPHHSKGVAPGTAKRIAMTLEGFRFDLESELKDEKETIVEERKHLQSKNYD